MRAETTTILKECRQYKPLILLSLNIPFLTEELKWSCEGAISPEECTSALDSFQNNKTPGNDGIPIEFYENSGLLLVNPSLNVQMYVFKKVKSLFPKNKQS